MSKIKVHRKGYDVKATTFQRGGKTVHRKGYHVGPTSYSETDRGAPGRGPKTLPTPKHGVMTRWAEKLGYLRRGNHVTDLSHARIVEFARALAAHIGPRKALGMFQVQSNFRANARGAAAADRALFHAGVEAIADEYGEELKPKAAIRANLRRGANPHGRG